MKRRVIEAPKFFFFDVGIVNALARRGTLLPGSELYGKAFEHLIFMEITAYAHYSEKLFSIHFWRTASQFEVDFVLGENEVAIEARSTSLANDNHLRGLRAFKEEYTARGYILVSLDPRPRRTSNGIEVLPWERFFQELWSAQII